MSIKTYIFDGLNGHCVYEVCRGQVNDDGVDIPRPLAQRPKRHPLQVSTQRVLAAGAQSGGVPVLHLSHPTQTGAVLLSSLQVLPSGSSLRGLSGWNDKHGAILSLRPRLVLPVWLCGVSPSARLFLHWKHWNGLLLLLSHFCTSLLNGQWTKWLMCPLGINMELRPILTVFLQPLSWPSSLLVLQPSSPVVSLWPPASSYRWSSYWCQGHSENMQRGKGFPSVLRCWESSMRLSCKVQWMTQLYPEERTRTRRG